MSRFIKITVLVIMVIGSTGALTINQATAGSMETSSDKGVSGLDLGSGRFTGWWGN